MWSLQVSEKMYSDDTYNSESEFYYPEDLIGVENERTPIQNDVNNTEFSSDIQDFILSKNNNKDTI